MRSCARGTKAALFIILARGVHKAHFCSLDSEQMQEYNTERMKHVSILREVIRKGVRDDGEGMVEKGGCLSDLP